MPTTDVAEYEKWARAKAGIGSRLRGLVMGPFYSITRAFDIRLSIARLFFGSIRLAATLLIAGAPIALKYGKDILSPSADTFSWKLTIAASIMIFCLMLYNKIYDYFIKTQKEQKEVLAQKQTLTVRLAKVTASIASANLQGLGTLDTERIVNDLLRCVLYEAKLSIGYFDQHYLEASILLFEDCDPRKIYVANRAVGDRAVNTSILADNTIAYHVATTGSHRAINSFKRDHPFPKGGLTEKKAKYKSILFIPVIPPTLDERYLCSGVLSIDSVRPYEFWGGRAERIVVEAQPYINLLRMMMPAVPTVDVT